MQARRTRRSGYVGKPLGLESVISSVASLDTTLHAGTLREAQIETGPLADFDAVVAEHQRRLFRVLLSITHDEDAAQTLTQECFLKAYKARSSFRGDAPLGAWLLRIAVNLGRDHVRNRRAGFWKRLFEGSRPDEDATALAPDRAPSAERVLLAREKASSVWDAAETLSAQQRTVFMLRFAEEMSLEEISRTTGLRLGTVKAHLFRALAAVRARVKESQ